MICLFLCKFGDKMVGDETGVCMVPFDDGRKVGGGELRFDYNRTVIYVLLLHMSLSASNTVQQWSTGIDYRDQHAFTFQRGQLTHKEYEQEPDHYPGA
jgi:hypothetical protein